MCNWEQRVRMVFKALLSKGYDVTLRFDDKDRQKNENEQLNR